METYDEIVFSEPSEAFIQRVRNHPAVMIIGSSAVLNCIPPSPAASVTENVNEKRKGDTKDHPLGQWFLKHNDAEELANLKEARQQVQNQIMKLKRDLSTLEAEATQLRANASH